MFTAHLFGRRVNEDRLANNLSLYSLMGTKITITIKKQIIVIGIHDGFQHTFDDKTPLKFENETFQSYNYYSVINLFIDRMILSIHTRF